MLRRRSRSGRGGCGVDSARRTFEAENFPGNKLQYYEFMVSANVLPCCTRCIPSSNQHCNYKDILPESRFPKAMHEGFYPGTARMFCDYISMIPPLAITIITSCIAMVYTNFADDRKIFGKTSKATIAVAINLLSVFKINSPLLWL